MSKEEKDRVEIVKISEDDEELDPEEIKELEGIIEEVTQESDGEDSIEEIKPQQLEEEEQDIDDDEEELEDASIEEGLEKEPREEVLSEDNQRNKEEIPDEKIETPNITSADLGEAKGSETPSEPIEDKPPIITNHVVPTDECWLVKLTKSGGFTLPKELREKIHPQQNFALVVEGHELAFYMINEDDIPKLRLSKKKVEVKPKAKKGKRGKKKREGPEPDFPRYFHFEVQEQDKVQDALESAFYKFAETPPAIGEAMNIIIYCLTSFTKNHKMNDSRLRQTVIFFLCHIIEQFNQPQLIDFIQREILDEIQSPYLYQICLNQLAYTSFIMEKPDKVNEFITQSLDVIQKYDKSEMYAIMDSFKHLTHTLTPIIGKKLSKEDLGLVKSSLDSYLDKLEDISYQIQYIEMLERMNFIDEAYNIAKVFMDKLEQESPLRDQFKEIRRRIGSHPE
jgi:hypothetical protein